MIMHNIHINNQSSVAAYVRLSSEKMQYSDSFVQKLEEELFTYYDRTRDLGWRKECAFSLAIGSFCFISPNGTLSLPVENAATSLYISVVCYEGIVGLFNFPFDPNMYGCISINLSLYRKESEIVLLPYNPKAAWFPAKSGDKLPTDFAVEAGVGRNVEERLYFGRMSFSVDSSIPCAVTSSGKCGKWKVGNYEGEKGDLLKNTGFELIRAKRGDPVPPNAVMTGVIPTVGSLFVGRVGGNIPCYITTENGKIEDFVYGIHREKCYAGNGEVMVLTS